MLFRAFAADGSLPSSASDVRHAKAWLTGTSARGASELGNVPVSGFANWACAHQARASHPSGVRARTHGAPRGRRRPVPNDRRCG
eukprot:7386967-Prymnesium_polylepis.2